jgi:hypothetical protein
MNAAPPAGCCHITHSVDGKTNIHLINNRNWKCELGIPSRSRYSGLFVQPASSAAAAARRLSVRGRQIHPSVTMRFRA